MLKEGTRIAVWDGSGNVRYGTVRGFVRNGIESRCLALMDDGFLASIDEASVCIDSEKPLECRYGEPKEVDNG